MPKLKLNFLNYFQEKKERKWFKKIFRPLIVLCLVVLLFFSQILFTSESILNEVPKLSFWKGVIKLVIFQKPLLKGEISDRINLLLLGMGGAEHEGAYLTDTIILVSLKSSTQQVALLSIPRDLYVPIPGYGWQKINAANAVGEIKEKDGGKLSSLVVSHLFDLPIHYYLRVDFEGFKKIIDLLGGIEVMVERSFIDSQFPAPYFKYQTIRFERGQQTFDGKRALEFVRSRHGSNGENSDFSRIKRQQKVLLAVKEKLKKIKILEEPKKIWHLLNLFEKYFKTNLEFDELISLGKIISQIEENKIITKSLGIEENGLLIPDINNGAYILRPKSGDFKELIKVAQEIFE